MKRKKWTEIELELTLAFYLFDKFNSDSNFYLNLFSLDLEKFTKTFRNSSTLGLRVANYHFYDAEFKGKGLFGGGKAAKEVFEKNTNPKDFEFLKRKYIDFINTFVDENNRKYYPDEKTILNSHFPSMKVIISSNLIVDTHFEDKEVKKMNDKIIALSPKNFDDKPIKLKSSKKTTKNYFGRNSQVAINAIAHSDYKCESDPSHSSFIRKNRNEPYLEPHHLIPLSKQSQFQYSLDVEANIVSLCSNCHNEVHYGQDYKRLIEVLFSKRKTRLDKVELKIELSNLIDFY
jgi:5-methylcytosine-specific restriction endonuclease McrA